MKTTGIERFARKVFQIQPGEGTRVIAFFLYLTVISLFYTLGITVGDSLFLLHFGVEGSIKFLPWTFIGLSISSLCILFLFGLLQKRLPKTTLIVCTELLFALVVIIYRFCLQFIPSGWLYIGLNVLMEVFACFSISLFFSFMGGYFTSRDARRLYAIITGGLPLGTFVAGYAVKGLLDVFALSDLLFLCAGLLVIVSLFPPILSKLFKNAKAASQFEAPGAGSVVPLRSVLSRPFIVVLYLMLICGAVYAVITLYQMKTMAVKAFEQEDLVIFFGNFWGLLGIVQLVVQFVLVGFFLKRLGLLGSLVLNPLSGLVMNLSGFLHPAVTMSALTNLTRITLGETLDLPAREILFFPLPLHLRARAQALAGAVLVPLGQGLAGGLLFLLIPFFREDAGRFSLLAFGFAGAWFLIILSLFPLYKKTLESSLRQWQPLDYDLKAVLDNPNTRKVIRKLLSSSRRQEQLVLLQLIEGEEGKSYAPEISRLVGSPHEDVACKALQFLGELGDKTYLTCIEKALRDQRENVAAQALFVAASLASGRAALKGYIGESLNAEQEGLRVAGAAAVIRYGNPDEQSLGYTHLYSLLESPNAEKRKECLKVMEKLGGKECSRLLRLLLLDNDKSVSAAALSAAFSLRDPDLFPLLARHLEQPPLRVHAIRAIQNMPESVVPAIVSYLGAHPGTTYESDALTRSLAVIGGSLAFDTLLGLVMTEQELLKALTAARSLVMLKEKKAEGISEEKLRESLASPMQWACSEIALLRKWLLMLGEHPQRRLLTLLLRDHARIQMEYLFVVLKLWLGDRRLSVIEFELLGDNPFSSANALELLEMILGKEIRKRILAAIDDFLSLLRTEEEARPALSPGALEREAGTVKTDTWLFNFLGFARASAHSKGDITMQPETNDFYHAVSIISFLKEIELFKPIPADYLFSLVELVKVKTFYPGEVIFKEGEPGDALYIIQKGEVSIRALGKEITRMGPGEALGEMSLIDSHPRSASALVLQEATLLSIANEEFHHLLNQQPSMAIALLKTLSLRLREETARRLA